MLAAGFGMLSLKTWAWWLGLIGAVWSLASSIWGLTQGASWCLALPAMILPAIMVFYLLQPRVRQAFRAAVTRPGAFHSPVRSPLVCIPSVGMPRLRPNKK